MYILPKIKKLAAISLAIILTLGAFGFSENKNLVTTSATQEQSEYAQQLEDLSEQQKSLEKKIAAANDSIEGEQKKLDAVVEQMNVISQKIKTAEKYSAEIEDEMCLLDEQMRETQYNLASKEEDIKTNVNGFMKRIRAMYISGTDSYTSIIADSADFYDILMRTELIKSVAKHDNDVINELTEQKNNIDAEKTKLEEQSDKLKTKSQEYANQQKTLSDEYTKLLDLQSTYGDSISQLESDKSKYQAEINQVIEQYSDLATQTTKQETQTTAAATEKAEKTTTAKKFSDGEKKTTTQKQSGNNNSKTETTTTKKTTEATKKETTSVKTEAPAATTPKQTTTSNQTTKAPVTTAAPSTDSSSSYDTKIEILMSTAKSMVGGSYVWGGTSPNATDCSGLTMQCYAKIGISLPHKASAQANYGTSVSYDNMKKGDLIFFGGSSYSSIYHVAIYIGDGKMIHAENTYTGIVMSYVSSFAKYNNITCIKRLI